MLDEPMSNILLLLVIRALTHHLLAGLRQLLSDINIGSYLRGACFSAWIVKCSGRRTTDEAYNGKSFNRAH